MSSLYDYFPIDLGETTENDVEIMHQTILDNLGSAFSKDPDSIQYIETLAYSHALTYLWSISQRFKNQFIPKKMTDFLERFERMYGLYPTDNATLEDRREKLQIKMSMRGKYSSIGETSTLLSKILEKDIFQSITYAKAIDVANDTTATVPGGATNPGGATYVDGDWRSPVCSIHIRVKKPDLMKWQDYYKSLDQIKYYLNDFLPTYVRWNWYDVTDHEWFILDISNLDRLALI